MWAMIATWCMSQEGVKQAAQQLKAQGSAAEALEQAICAVEDFPYYKSVGYGGLPNEEMEVELDAAFMDGDTLDVGAVAALRDFANPIKIARRLSQETINCMLVGRGAEKFAHQAGFERKNMLTERSRILYRRQLQKSQDELKAYRGHDTVGMVCLDQSGKVCAATSTSGLFLKKAGRVGDSPLVGSGFYADSEIGGACATGLGEDLMKGCIAYETVRLMKTGYSAQEACDQAILELEQKLRNRRKNVGDLSVVALSAKGDWGAATNLQEFSFVVASPTVSATVFLCQKSAHGCKISPASDLWQKAYRESRMAPLEEEE